LEKVKLEHLVKKIAGAIARAAPAVNVDHKKKGPGLIAGLYERRFQEG